MCTMIIFLYASLIIDISGRSFPYIQDVVLRASAYSVVNITVRSNSSCQACLCENLVLNYSTSYVALNCLANETCQLFSSFPSSYKLSASNGSRLYFLQSQFPNASQCCMSNITELIARLTNATPITINLSFSPSAFGYDSTIPFEAAVIGSGVGALYWFNPRNMTLIRSNSINTSLTVTLYNNQTFTGVNGDPTIYIKDKQTNNNLGNIRYPTMGQIRKVIFMNNGQTVVVSTQNNKSLTVFDVNASMNYTFQRTIALPLQNVHGIAMINDTFLYVSSSNDRRIVSCEYENSTWTPEIFVNYSMSGAGYHLAVDDCERVWFINTQFGLRIYDASGVEIASWNMNLNSSNTIYDILLLPTYMFYWCHT